MHGGKNSWEWLFVAKESLCMCGNWLCESEKIVGYIKVRKVWVCGETGHQIRPRGNQPISYHIIFSSLN